MVSAPDRCTIFIVRTDPFLHSDVMRDKYHLVTVACGIQYSNVLCRRVASEQGASPYSLGMQEASPRSLGERGARPARFVQMPSTMFAQQNRLMMPFSAPIPIVKQCMTAYYINEIC